MPKAQIVVGLGYGDEGKGTITEFASHRIGADTVVRYNGGAQAAHNVVTSDGRHHTFSQFGSATLLGVKTHLSRFMVFDIMAMRNEAKALSDNFGINAMKLLTVEEGALLITPYQVAANRLREIERGDGRHGSCGRGVGETRSDFLKMGGDAVPVVGDLLKPPRLLEKLRHIRDLKIEEFQSRRWPVDLKETWKAFDLLTAMPEYVLGLWVDVAKKLKIVGPEHLSQVLKTKRVVFEGAQGVLLDQDFGFQPYTTWTTTTTRNAWELLDESGADVDVTTIGVTRTYTTRHGAGPLPTEVKWAEGLDPRNPENYWQKGFRCGYLDLVTLRYALDVQRLENDRVDFLALTHLDEGLDKMGVAYNTGVGLTAKPNPTVEEQSEKARFLEAVTSVKYVPFDVLEVEDRLETKVGIWSSGPCLRDKTTFVL